MSAQNDFDKAVAALENPSVKSYTYKGVKYSLTQLRDVLIPRLRAAAKEESTAEELAEGTIKYSEREVKDARDAVARALQNAKGVRQKFNQNRTDQAALDAAEKVVLDAQTTLDTLLGKEPATVVTPRTAPKTPGAGFVPPVPMGVVPTPSTTQPPTTTATTTTTDTTTPPTGTATSPTTDKGKKGGKKQPTPTGTGPLGLTAKTRADLIKQFPQFSSSFDGGEGEQAFIDFFGQDAADLIVKAGTTDTYAYLETDGGLAAYRRDFENTAYGQRTTQAQQDFDVNPKNQAVLIKAKQDEITKSYADLQLTQTQLQEVAKEAARNAYSGDALRFAVYNYAYKGNQVTATESALADQIRNAGKAYGYTVSEDKLKAALTGTPYLGRMVTQESLLQEAQAAAKGSYGHLADQIDSGLTLEDIFYNYRMFASRTLGLDPNEIDFMKDSRFAEAFGTKETGQMSLNDWAYKLKSDKRYGYQFSPDAQQEVSSLVSTLEKAFGFRQ